LDACFTQKRTNNPQNSASHDPPNPTSTVFIPESEVKAMELFIEKQQSLPSNQHYSLTQNQQKLDDFEDGMKVPVSVLDGCGNSFHAADEKQQKANTHFFADTGIMALLCHHDHVLWLVNMTSAGEKQHYALVLVKHLFDHLPAMMKVGLLYDIGCQLECSCHKWKLLDEGILSRLKFGVSVFHAYGHQWPCQIVYHPCKCVGFGLSDGEGCEWLWSSLKKLIPILQVSGVSGGL
jgi:Kyakuja-Dileera-Zisupton transposase